jgi:hypothetical protein
MQQFLEELYMKQWLDGKQILYYKRYVDGWGNLRVIKIMPLRHPYGLLGNLLHVTFPPTWYTNQWTIGQWHQSLIQNSRHITNPPTQSVTQSHSAWHSVHTLQPGKSNKSIFLHPVCII